MRAESLRSGIFYPLGYNPSLDGLRAFSVIAVLLYHAEIPGFSWGFAGVIVFFVISGFLITGALFSEYAHKGEISLGAFYKRRALRLLPALANLCAIFLSLSALTEPGISHALKEVAIVALYSMNWVRAFHIGWTPYLSHTWSLAIEEQYYLFWPLIVMALLRFNKNRLFIIAAIMGLILMVVTWRALLSIHDADAAYLANGTDTRMDALLIGSALAVASGTKWAQLALAAACKRLWFPAIVLLVGLPSIFPYEGGWMFLCGYIFIALCSAVLVMASGADGSFQRLFGMRPFVWIGQRSYGIYLWHYMILQFGLLSFKLPIGIAGPISILGGLLCAAVSYRWIERPFLRRKYSSAPREALIEAPQAGVTT